MPRSSPWGWRGVALIGITYVYFLIFAQFAFIRRLAGLGITDAHLKAVMAAMAAGGVALSLLAPRLTLLSSPGFRLRVAFLACAVASFLSLLAMPIAAAMIVSCLIGCGLGLLTVTLVTHLRLWLGRGDPLLRVAAGTGLGYFVCNIPYFFTASATVQAVTAGSLCLAGVFLTLRPPPAEPSAENASVPKQKISFLPVLICFTALVWLDSAAFFIIQNTPLLKAGTWQGTVHLWVNALLHLAAALACAWFLRRRGLFATLALAFLALASACLLLLDPSRGWLASAFYPVGVSLYSVALVAYPSLLAPAGTVGERGRQAGWIYAVAGWCGSAMGIGMGQNLGHVPPAFVLLAGLLILAPGPFAVLRQRKREITVTLGILLAAWGIERATSAAQRSPPGLSAVERGRKVYIAEGCINCHSQYVRPHTADVLMWGPVEGLEELRQQKPPLIGNRRQGPDLAEVASRRSALWLRAHFYDPSQVSHASFMPSYAYLFHDSRGDDLLAYLKTLQAGDIANHLSAERSWRPSSTATMGAQSAQGAVLFQDFCATCHASDGRTRQLWRESLRRLPPDLFTGPYLYLAASDSPAQQQVRLAQIVKFGLHGTDMPGHEYLSDPQIASLSLWLEQNIARPERNSTTTTSGEKQ
jgi:mono/diheme cytochrome c family protein